MTTRAIEELEDVYPDVIAQMGEKFDSHEFLLKLAQGHQQLYAQAVGEYSSDDKPFRTVQGLLIKGLLNFPSLVKRTGVRLGKDLFQQDDPAITWMKLKE